MPAAAPQTAPRWQFLRFLGVGAVAFAINMVVFVLTIEWLGIPYLVATVIVFFAGNVWGWVGNRLFTFRSQGRPTPELARYLTVMAISLALNLACMYVLVTVMGLHYLVASVVAGALFLVANFLVHRRVTFQGV
jgi:putative flippase GtrA